MDERLMTPWKEYLVFILIFGLALAWATQVDNITGMASLTVGTNTSLEIFSDTDTMNRSQGEIMHFYANYTNLTGWPIDNATGNSTCLIEFSDSPAVFNMSFNISGNAVYEYSRIFPAPATYSWNVTCVSDSYEALATSDSSVIRVTYCGKSISGSMVLTQDLSMENGSTSCSESGLIVDGSNLLLDCAGFSIRGIGKSSGIALSGATNVTVVNCTIEDFQKGIMIDSASSGNLFHHNIFRSNTLHAYSDNPANQFNMTIGGRPIGNNWDNTALLAIFDSNADNYGDFGQQYPYNSTNGGVVSANVEDYGPVASRLDSDNDGSPDEEDCDDANPAVMAPRDDLIITRDSTLCAGTYYINDSWRSGIIRFNTSNVTLDCKDAVSLIGNGSGAGIYIDVGNNTVLDCNLSGYYDGIVVSDVNYTNISGVYSYSNIHNGIKLSNASRSDLSSMEVFNNSNAGILLTTYSEDNNLTNLSAYDNYIGVYLYYSGGNNLDGVSSFSNTWYGIFLERSEWNSLGGVDYHDNLRGIYLSYAHNNNLTSINSYDNHNDGVLLWFSDSNRLWNVSSYNNNGSGLVLWTGRYNGISNSAFSGNALEGIIINLSRFTEVFGVNVSNNTGAGVFDDSSMNTSVAESNLSGNGFGMRVSSSTNATVRLSRITGSTRSGILVSPSVNTIIESNNITGSAHAGVNVSGDGAVSVLNSTLQDAAYGVWVSDSSGVNLTNSTLCGNTYFGAFYLNSTLKPALPEIIGSNTFCTDNILGMLSFNWHVQLHALDWLGNNYSDVPLNMTFVGSVSPQQNTTTLSTSLTQFLAGTEFIINNSAARENRTYNITGRKGDFYGFNTTNITENRIWSESDEIFITLDQPLPPRVYLISPGNNTTTTDHAVTFICNASHEGGLSNVTLYHNISGNWTGIVSNNLTGVVNQTLFSLSPPDAFFGWNCLAFSAFSTSSFAEDNFTMSLYTPPPPPGGGGGGDEGTAEAPAAPPAPSPPASPPAPSPPSAPAPSPGESGPADSGPAVSAPSAAESRAEMRKDVVDTNTQVSCDDEVSIVEENISAEDIVNLIDIPEGYVIAAKPFKANCQGGESFKMSVVVPDTLGDIQAIRCVGSACNARTTTVTNRICPGKDVETYRNESVFSVGTAAVNVSFVAGNMSEGNLSLTSGNVSVDFGEDVEASLGMVTEDQPQPVNRNLRIVGTPIVIALKHAKERQGIVNITLPYVVRSDDDEYSVAVYAKQVLGNVTDWVYLGGGVDTSRKVVLAEVNLSAYEQDGKVTIAPMTVLCTECGEAQFTNKFTPVPDTRQAIVLLHGLWGVGKVWEGLINEFRQTNQPYQLWTFHYLANRPIADSAKDLANYLEVNSHRFDRLYIVGYSLGGLVTQAGLDYAYRAHQENASAYTFIDKLDKVLLVSVPNRGSPVAGYLSTFLSEYINSQANEVIPLNDAVKNQLEQGVSINPLPNVSYYSIAGTKSYPFMTSIGLDQRLFKGELNDGLVSVSSATTVGNNTLDQYCINFWSQPVVHTLMIDDRLVQKIMGQIISSDARRELSDADVSTNLFGFSNYFELDIEDCSPDDLYVVIGKEKPPEEIERSAYCACGNGMCDGLEDRDTCPEDCSVQKKPFIQRMIERSLSILALLIGLFMLGGFVFVVWEGKKKKRESAKGPAVRVPEGFNLREDHVSGDVKYMRTELMDLKSALKQVQEHRWLVGDGESRKALSKEAADIQARIDRINETLLREGIAQSIEKIRPLPAPPRSLRQSIVKKPKSAVRKKVSGKHAEPAKPSRGRKKR